MLTTMTTNTNTNTKRMLGPLARAEEWDDWKYKSTAKLITEGLWQPVAEGRTGRSLRDLQLQGQQPQFGHISL